jgi:hypothetical protein
LHAHFVVVLATHEIVQDGHLVTDIGQVQGRWPAKVAIATENQYAHENSFQVRTPFRRYRRDSRRIGHRSCELVKDLVGDVQTAPDV